MNIELKHIKYIPSDLKFGILYVSHEYQVAAHLCPCGCSNKIVTPLGINEWEFSQINGKPCLYPSIGNWQLPCRSHYWVAEGEILWAGQWTEKQIKRGREAEIKQDIEYYKSLQRKSKKDSFFKKLSKIFYFGIKKDK